MKARMSETGVLEVTPENSGEAFALRAWAQVAVTEDGNWKHSHLCVYACRRPDPQPIQPSMPYQVFWDHVNS